jgi:hypothetical protein
MAAIRRRVAEALEKRRAAAPQAPARERRQPGMKPDAVHDMLTGHDGFLSISISTGKLLSPKQGRRQCGAACA